ncbi:hypothetical protein [Salibaculum griseiflavum]|uniref:Response regulatory domain-containing protein n=1 Tax=Salibaculum griseiflavum TaxID=1914409 RepID=A0A2V1P650_9RHOB|nr:hypothetical protein [Salibaculum griseiflavum]PWG17955.1 hypothetical protein DFK10_04410 [Salibaculum griseiflavum]
MFNVFDGPDAKCIILSSRPFVLDSLRDLLEQNEAELVQVTDYTALDRTLRCDPEVNFVIIDLDSFDSVISQFESLSRMRVAHCDRPTILLSEEFETDEFGTHRKMLGDISLRVPVLHASLEIALLQAPVNNLEWRKHLDAVPSAPDLAQSAQHEAIGYMHA